MNAKHHFKLLARYNARINEQVYQVVEKLDCSILNRDSGTFFGSILGTLNHLLVGDLIWLSRFINHSECYVSLRRLKYYPEPKSLNVKIYTDFEALRKTRKEVDQIIIDWIDETSEIDFDRSFTYKNAQGVRNVKNFGEVLSHLFNHQTHHRGQVSTLLSQHGFDVGVTDYIIDVPDEQL